MAFLDPRVWLVVLALLAGAFGAGYFKGGQAARVAAKAEAADTLARARASEDALRESIGNAAVALAKEKQLAQDLGNQLRNRVRSGDVRLSIPASPAACPRQDSAAGDPEARTELDRATAEALVAITQSGDEAIRELNSCIDRYNAIRGQQE